MIVLLTLLILMNVWHFHLYKAFQKVTYKTLYAKLGPDEWRDYLINQAIRKGQYL